MNARQRAGRVVIKPADRLVGAVILHRSHTRRVTENAPDLNCMSAEAMGATGRRPYVTHTPAIGVRQKRHWPASSR
jgi:hypothetical protein